ncbi:MAG: DUF3617 domain-containing protein [Alphaproteobacteria bacterium]|nr:MAG: DUF3617 domain-containing protein [Alphaproteobacteria bacterium]
MRTSALLASFASILLAACGGEADDSAAAGGDLIDMKKAAARAKATAVKPQPGQYRVTLEVLEVKIPGAPPSMADMMKQAMGGQVHEYCLKPGDVDRGFEEMAKQSQEGDNCSFQRFNAVGGNIDAQMTCKNPGQGTMTMVMKGVGTPTRSEMNMTMTGNMTGMGDSTIRVKSTHERMGECN